MHRFHPYPYHKRTAAPYDVEVQKRWLDAALTDGAPTLHHSTARSLAASISDHDPSSVELNRLQRELRVFNRNRQLVTFDPPTMSWRPFVRPSRTIANGKTIPIQPSGYRNLPRTALPLCPHAYNKVRNEDECRMSYHTHQHPLLGSVPYLQVDPRTLHHCSFILVLHENIDVKPKLELDLKPGLQLDAKPRRSIHTSHCLPISSVRPIKREPAVANLAAVASSSRVKVEDSTFDCRQVKREFTPDIELIPPPNLSVIQAPRPRPRPRLQKGSLSHIPSSLYTSAEAALNIGGSDPAFIALSQAEHARILATRAYNTHFLLDDLSALFPTRMLRYRNGSPFASRILEAYEFTTTETGCFIRALCRSHGVPSHTYDLFCNLLITCIGCGNHFTIDAYDAHLVDLPTKTTCRNDSTHSEVQRFDITFPRETLPSRDFPTNLAPGQSHAAPFAEFLYTAIGIALLALNTQFGLPDDVWHAVRSAVVPCGDCGFMRTVHGHVHHAPNGRCNDIGTHQPSIILTGGGMGKVQSGNCANFKPIVVYEDE